EDWDEAIFAQISREMLRSGDWLTPHWGYEPYFNKPPLLMWLTASVYLVLGVGEAAARSVSALSGIGVVVVAYLIGREAYGRGVGLLSALVLLTGEQFVRASRFGTTDVLLTLSLSVAAYGYLLTLRRSPRWWCLSGAAFGVACMVKGAGALVAPAAIGLTLLLDRRVGVTLRSRFFWYGAVLALAIALPWHAYMYAEHGTEWVDRYLAYNVVDRATEPIEGHDADPDFYLEILQENFLPWVYLLPVALALAMQGTLGPSARARIVIVQALLVFLLYSFVGTKLRWYIMPMYPMLAVMIAATLRGALADLRSVAAAGLVVACVGAVLEASFALQVAFGAVAVLALAGTRAKLPLAPRLVAPAAVLLLAAVGAGTVWPVYRHDEGQERGATLAMLARAQGATSPDPLLLISGMNRPTALFYGDRAVVHVKDSEDLPARVEAQGSVDVIVKDADARPLRAS